MNHEVGRTIEEVFPDLSAVGIPYRYRQIAATGESWSTDQLIYTDDRISGAFEVYAFQTSPGNMAAMFLDVTERKRAQETLREVMHTPPDGVIIMGTELTPSAYPLLDLLTVPTVVLDNGMNDMHIDSVVMDNEAISAEAVRYLHSIGHREIGYIRFSIPICNCEERYQGYLKQMTKLGLPIPEPVMVMPTLKDAYRDMKKLLAEGGYVPHGAAVADNDTVAIGVMRAIQEAGYKIPEDLSIIGVDDIPFSAMTMPGLTTMHISRSAMGALAVDALRKRIEYADWPSMHTRIAGRLVVRGSTMPLQPR